MQNNIFRVLRFSPTIPPLGGGMPDDLAMTSNSKIQRVTKMGIKKIFYHLVYVSWMWMVLI